MGVFFRENEAICKLNLFIVQYYVIFKNNKILFPILNFTFMNIYFSLLKKMKIAIFRVKF